MSLAYKEQRAIKIVKQLEKEFLRLEMSMKFISPFIQKKELIINEFKTPDWTCEFQRGARVTATINICTGQFIRFDFHD